MDDLKFELLQRISKSSPVSPLRRDTLYKEAGTNINNVAAALNVLLEDNLIQKPHGSDSFYVTGAGRTALEQEAERREMLSLQRESIDLQKKTLSETKRVFVPNLITAIATALAVLLAVIEIILQS